MGGLAVLPLFNNLIKDIIMMKNMQSLAVVERLFPLIVSGDKISTIRWHKEHITLGPLMFFCKEDPNLTVLVTVTRCTEMPLSDAAAFIGRSDEWPDKIMLTGMQEHYPDIALSSLVQVIEYDPPTLHTH
jgi:hypothetical protein